MTMVIGSTAGDGTDLYARLIARHMSRHIPGRPQIVAINTPGANGLLAANRLFNLDSKDGLSIGTFSRYAVYEPLWNNPSARFVPERFNWIGNVSVDVSVCVTWHAAGAKTLSDLMTRELKMGTTNASYINILNNVFGAKLHAIKGYPGGNEVNLALERGEVDGRCAISWSALTSTRSEWLRDNKIDLLIQFTHRKHPELRNVPSATDLVVTDSQRQILNLILMSQQLARVIVAPPDVPKDRVNALRKAFDDTMKDPDFISAAAGFGAPVDPVPGIEIQKLVEDMYRNPPDVIKTFYEAVGGKL